MRSWAGTSCQSRALLFSNRLMNRRKALKNIGLLTGGIVLFPACDLSKENVSRVMNKLKVTETEEALLANLADTMIPESEIPGALALNVSDFVWVMVDDCLDPELQGSFMTGLGQFKKRFREISGSDFDSSEQSEKVRGLNAMVQKDPQGDDAVDGNDSIDDVTNFVEITKWFAIQGYTQSRYVMTEVMPYALIPGKFPQCRTIEPNEKININA